MKRAVPLEIHDDVNFVQYLLDAAFMAAGALNREETSAMQSLLEIIQKRVLKIEADLEALDAGQEGGEA